MLRKTGIGEAALASLIQLLFQNIITVPLEQSLPFFTLAKDIMREIDVKDAPILACALAVNADGIWTDDVHFRKQCVVRAYTTAEISAVLRRQP